MSEKTRDNSVSFRLDAEHNEKLEMLANSFFIPKSTMAANIVANVLDENMQEFQINHISYPRPIIKKLFSSLINKQLENLIGDINAYNKEVIESAKRTCDPDKIMNSLKKSWKSYGCEVRVMTFDDTQVLEIHHEMERNWSTATCATTSFILQLLGFKVTYTTVTSDWFKIEYIKNGIGLANSRK